MKPTALPFFVSTDDPPAKQAILLGAMDLFATRGVDGVTVRDIAARSGYTNPALFKHFATKDDLARSLFEACYRRLAAALAMPGADLRAVVTAALALIETAPDAVHFTLENLRRFWRDMPDDLRAQGLPGAMRRRIEQAQGQGSVRADIDPALAGSLVLGMLAQIARMAHFAELPGPAGTLADAVFAMIDRGIGA